MAPLRVEDGLRAATPPEAPRRPLVVGLGGTLRAESSTQRALVVALEAAERTGTETTLLDSRALELPLYDPTAAATPAVDHLISAVRRADGLIVASPGYHGGPSGLVKNALDYLEGLRTDERPYLDGRAVGCIVCAAGWQATTTTLVSLRSMVHALRGWPTPLGVAINATEPLVNDDGAVREHVRAQLELLGQQVAAFALRQHASRA